MERHEPTISTLSSSPEELPRNNARQQHASNTAAKNTGATTMARTPQARQVIVKSSPLVPFTFLLAIAALALAGFSYWQLMQSQKGLVLAEARIAELEGKLDLSDDESSASITAVQAKLKWADSEIRKLWGVSHDKNRKSISSNKDKLTALSKQMKSQEPKLNAAVSGVDSIKAQIGSVNQKLSQQQTQVQMLSDRLIQLEETEAALQQRINEHEQAIQAIDSFRRKVNRELLVPKSGGTP